MNEVWLDTIRTVFTKGVEVRPRGKPTVEILHHTVKVDMRFPVLTVPWRKLSHKFMAAEAFWILSGDDTVAGIAPWNSKIAEFSDDGKIFAGAYGPRISQQIAYVVSKLLEDPDTRQAVITTWVPNPKPSRDIPCTVAFDFKIRNDRLHLQVFMRSSDIWLGLPYDVFNFSMLATLVCGCLNKAGHQLTPGRLYLTAASSHLYAANFAPIVAHLDKSESGPGSKITPPELYHDPDILMVGLNRARDDKAARWWL